MASVFDPLCLLRVLDSHDVDHVLVEGLAAVLHGAPVTTTDADIVPDMARENLERLSAALDDLDARLRTANDPDGVPFPPHPELLASVSMLNMTTRCGDLDLTIAPAGIAGYADARLDAVEFEVEEITVVVASLDKVIASKAAADRAKDHVALPILYALREELESS